MDICPACGTTLPPQACFCGMCGTAYHSASLPKTLTSMEQALSNISAEDTVIQRQSNPPPNVTPPSAPQPMPIQRPEYEQRARQAELVELLPTSGVHPAQHIPSIQGVPQPSTIPTLQGTPSTLSAPGNAASTPGSLPSTGPVASAHQAQPTYPSAKAAQHTTQPGYPHAQPSHVAHTGQAAAAKTAGGLAEELLTETRKDELARTYQLGSFQKEYRVRTVAVIANTVLFVLGIGGFLIFCIVLLTIGNYLGIAILIGLILWLGKGGVWPDKRWRWVAHRRNWRIYLYEHGLIYYGQGLYAMHWNSVQSIIHKIVANYDSDSGRYFTHHYKIYCRDGTELAARGVIAQAVGETPFGRALWSVINEGTFVRGAELIKTIEQRTAPYLLEEALHLLKSTGQASFGALTVSQQGLLVRGNFLPWQELKSFSIRGTAVAFKKKDKWLAWQRCELGAVVNYEVFRQLAGMFGVN